VLETIPVMQFFKRFNKSTAGGYWRNDYRSYAANIC
jgi:hypothetical protein